jgi:hypothetical protein
MYFLKNYKQQKDLNANNSVVNKQSSSALENKSIPESDSVNFNSNLPNNNLKNKEDTANLTNQFEKIDLKKKLCSTGTGFFQSKTKIGELENSNIEDKRNSPKRYNDLITPDIREIAQDYKRNIHTSNERRFRENSFVKTIKLKSLESDIFFKKGKEKPKELNRNAILKRASSESNVFFLQNKGMVKDRSCEKYYYNPKTQIYGTFSISNSEWCPNTENRSIINFTNTEYSLFNPEKKNLSKMKDSINKIAKVNPIFKQKSISESLDIFGNTCFNPNRNFVEIANNHPKAFYKNSECCATFLDLHRNYGGLFPKPFTKKIV